jgi:hypothetical protein
MAHVMSVDVYAVAKTCLMANIFSFGLQLNNGRLAMIAITGYAFNEAATKVSVAAEFNLPQ